MPTKTFARVMGECKTLARLECRAYMLYHARMPDDLAACDTKTALLLYAADVLKFERVGDSNLDRKSVV